MEGDAERRERKSESVNYDDDSDELCTQVVKETIRVTAVIN